MKNRVVMMGSSNENNDNDYLTGRCVFACVPLCPWGYGAHKGSLIETSRCGWKCRGAKTFADSTCELLMLKCEDYILLIARRKPHLAMS